MYPWDSNRDPPDDWDTFLDSEDDNDNFPCCACLFFESAFCRYCDDRKY